MIIIAIRTVLLYVAALIVVRLMGRGELSKLDPFQMVVLFMIAELASLSIESPNISVFTGLTALLTLLFLQVLFSYISLKSTWFRNLISGKAILMVDKGKINEKELERLRISIDDLTQHLRLKNIPSPADVDYAILETNGDLSVIPKPDKRPLTPADIGLFKADEKIPLVLIADGQLYLSNLMKLQKNENDLKQELSKQGIENYDQIFLCFADEKGAIKAYCRSEETNSKNSAKIERWDVQ